MMWCVGVCASWMMYVVPRLKGVPERVCDDGGWWGVVPERVLIVPRLAHCRRLVQKSSIVLA